MYFDGAFDGARPLNRNEKYSGELAGRWFWASTVYGEWFSEKPGRKEKNREREGLPKLPYLNPCTREMLHLLEPPPSYPQDGQDVLRDAQPLLVPGVLTAAAAFGR